MRNRIIYVKYTSLLLAQAPGAEIHDPTNNGAKCDFCSWPTLTATDPGFQRIELPHAVTGSNLFKYAEPSHGIVLFKHHQPLEFSQEALADMLDASWLWFQASHKLNPRAVEPFFLWNCLPRAGASQYHGHAQVCCYTGVYASPSFLAPAWHSAPITVKKLLQLNALEYVPQL